MSAATHPITELGLCLKSVECDTEIDGVLAWSLESLLGEVFLEAQRMKECPAHSRGDSSSWTSLFILFGTLCAAPAGRAEAHLGQRHLQSPFSCWRSSGARPPRWPWLCPGPALCPAFLPQEEAFPRLPGLPPAPRSDHSILVRCSRNAVRSWGFAKARHQA